MSLDRIVDQHMHTYFSPDSSERFEAYLSMTEGIVVSTEHVDFSDLNYEKRDMVFDYEAYIEEIKRLRRIYGPRIRVGVELGFREESLGKMEAFMEGKSFDLVLLSVHQNSSCDYMGERVEREDILDFSRDYYSNLLKAVSSFKDYDVLGHIDYCLRFKDYDLKELKVLEPVFREILTKLIANGSALEINTRSVYQYGGLAFYDYILDLYFQLGGELLSLGSDAHKTNRFKYRFEDALEFLRSKGVTRLATFEARELKFIEI